MVLNDFPIIPSYARIVLRDHHFSGQKFATPVRKVGEARPCLGAVALDVLGSHIERDEEIEHLSWNTTEVEILSTVNYQVRITPIYRKLSAFFPNLQSLSVTNCHLQLIEDLFPDRSGSSSSTDAASSSSSAAKGFTNLRILQLQCNEISTFPESFSAVENISRLDISHNIIRSFVEIGKLAFLKNLKDLDLSNNPIQQLNAARYKVLFLVPQLHILDGTVVDESTRGRILEGIVLMDEVESLFSKEDDLESDIVRESGYINEFIQNAQSPILAKQQQAENATTESLQTDINRAAALGNENQYSSCSSSRGPAHSESLFRARDPSGADSVLFDSVAFAPQFSMQPKGRTDSSVRVEDADPDTFGSPVSKEQRMKRQYFEEKYQRERSRQEESKEDPEHLLKVKREPDLFVEELRRMLKQNAKTVNDALKVAGFVGDFDSLTSILSNPAPFMDIFLQLCTHILENEGSPRKTPPPQVAWSPSAQKMSPSVKNPSVRKATSSMSKTSPLKMKSLTPAIEPVPASERASISISPTKEMIYCSKNVTRGAIYGTNGSIDEVSPIAAGQNPSPVENKESASYIVISNNQNVHENIQKEEHVRDQRSSGGQQEYDIRQEQYVAEQKQPDRESSRIHADPDSERRLPKVPYPTPVVERHYERHNESINREQWTNRDLQMLQFQDQDSHSEQYYHRSQSSSSYNSFQSGENMHNRHVPFRSSETRSPGTGNYRALSAFRSGDMRKICLPSRLQNGSQHTRTSSRGGQNPEKPRRHSSENAYLYKTSFNPAKHYYTEPYQKGDARNERMNDLRRSSDPRMDASTRHSSSASTGHARSSSAAKRKDYMGSLHFTGPFHYKPEPMQSSYDRFGSTPQDDRFDASSVYSRDFFHPGISEKRKTNLSMFKYAKTQVRTRR